MTRAPPPHLWQVFLCGWKDSWSAFWPELPDGLRRRFATPAALLVSHQASHHAHEGQRFLIGPDGRPDARVNAFFASATMGSLSAHTNRKYAYSVGVWLNFLLRHRSGRRWFEAERDEFEDFTYWRMTDERNPRRVTETTWRGDLAALSAFYGWAAHEYGVHNPIPPRELRQHRRVGRAFTPPSRRPAFDASTGNAGDSAGRGDRDVTWLTPLDYQRWVDLGLHGIGPDGREARVWRGRNTQRDVAFADLLYGTGLRLQEAGSLLVDELPPLHRERPFYTGVLATRCATGSRGRNYYMPLRVLEDLYWYMALDGERSAAIAQAQRAHRYESIPRLRLLVQLRDRTLRLHAAGDSASYDMRLDDLGPRERRTLFKETPSGLEPLALWVNEDGLPRDFHGWETTFATANRRIRRLGIADLEATPRMLRHSFAHRWYSIVRNLEERRFGQLTEDETRDDLAQFGGAWEVVRRLLGHASVETTMRIYLEPFQASEIDLHIVPVT